MFCNRPNERPIYQTGPRYPYIFSPFISRVDKKESLGINPIRVVK